MTLKYIQLSLIIKMSHRKSILQLNEIRISGRGMSYNSHIHIHIKYCSTRRKITGNQETHRKSKLLDAICLLEELSKKGKSIKRE